MKTFIRCVSLVCVAAAGTGRAQTADDLQIVVEAHKVAVDGGESANIFLSTGPIVIGKATKGTFSAFDCGYFSLEAGHAAFQENATAGWRVELTPTRVVDGAVTFRLRWLRALDTTKGLAPASEDVEVTLRSGESRPMDILPVSAGAKTFNGKPCTTTAASLRVTVEPHPHEEFERRLVAADMWLVEKRTNGGERSQSLSLRGLPHRSIPFYFESIAEEGLMLDILGDLVARPEADGMKVSFRTRSLLRKATSDWSPWRWVKSDIHVKPEEIVEVGLPKLTEYAEPFANRVFSIRIRARRLR